MPILVLRKLNHSKLSIASLSNLLGAIAFLRYLLAALPEHPAALRVVHLSIVGAKSGLLIGTPRDRVRRPVLFARYRRYAIFPTRRSNTDLARTAAALRPRPKY